MSRVPEELRTFVESHAGKAIMKPLQGSGGQGVFAANPRDNDTFNQMIEAVARDGYVVAQEYLPAAAKGDVRLFLMNGRPLEAKGAVAAFARERTGSDIRSNMRVGARATQAVVTDEVLRIAEIVRPKLIRDGMFFVGLDIPGDKLRRSTYSAPETWQRQEARQGGLRLGRRRGAGTEGPPPRNLRAVRPHGAGVDLTRARDAPARRPAYGRGRCSPVIDRL